MDIGDWVHERDLLTYPETQIALSSHVWYNRLASLPYVTFLLAYVTSPLTDHHTPQTV